MNDYLWRPLLQIAHQLQSFYVVFDAHRPICFDDNPVYADTFAKQMSSCTFLHLTCTEWEPGFDYLFCYAPCLQRVQLLFRDHPCRLRTIRAGDFFKSHRTIASSQLSQFELHDCPLSSDILYLIVLWFGTKASMLRTIVFHRCTIPAEYIVWSHLCTFPSLQRVEMTLTYEAPTPNRPAYRGVHHALQNTLPHHVDLAFSSLYTT